MNSNDVLIREAVKDSFSESFKVSIAVRVALLDFNFVVTPYIFEMLYLIYSLKSLIGTAMRETYEFELNSFAVYGATIPNVRG